MDTVGVWAVKSCTMARPAGSVPAKKKPGYAYPGFFISERQVYYLRKVIFTVLEKEPDLTVQK